MTFLGAACVALHTGCSTFQREWNQTPSEVSKGFTMAGRWQGTWVSEKNGHHGELRCAMQPLQENRYRAHFHATYWGIFRFRYPVELAVEPGAGTNRFSGRANLGVLAGGEYRYEGSAGQGVFDATYRSKYDFGRFKMKRVE